MNPEILQAIHAALDADDLSLAQSLLKDAAEIKFDEQQQATYFYLEGKMHMKQAQWGAAMSSFLQSEALEPEGPARECRLMLKDIMDFYNKDMFNQ